MRRVNTWRSHKAPSLRVNHFGGSSVLSLEHTHDGPPKKSKRPESRGIPRNVLGNAVKFTHEGSAISVRAQRHDGGITVEVEDCCGGLPRGNTTELFEPFVQRGENRTGFGLGLAIVKQALEAHGGRVSVRNLPGKGCVFALELPDSTDG
jgi:light-regulated signal transduction histidine kinase (bacteriophytochrome)